MMMAIVVALYAAVFFLDFFPSRSTDPKGVKALYLVLTFASFAVMVIISLGVKVPPPSDPIREAVKAIFGMT